jgi:predicted ATP-dependent serine protease
MNSHKTQRKCGRDGTVFMGSCPKCGNHNGTLVPKNPAAVELGRRGGRNKNKKLTPQQRKQIGKQLAEARARKRLAAKSQKV